MIRPEAGTSVDNTLTEMPELLKVPHIASVLGYSTKSVYKLVAQRTIPSIHIGRQVRIPKTAFIEWLYASSVSTDEAVKNSAHN